MRKLTLLLTTALLVASFLWGLFDVWRLRLATGTVYPAYSSLRADPLGTKVLHAGLARLAGVHVQRHYRPLTALPPASGTTLLFLGLTAWSLESLPDTSVQHLDAFVQQGGRLVLALASNKQSWYHHQPPVEHPKETAADDTAAAASSGSLLQRWGVRVQALPETARKGPWTAIPGTAWSPHLPQALVWRSPLSLTELDAAWRVLYVREQQAVLIERSLGAGTIVLLADVYPFSNEAMWRARQPALLAWMLGSPHHVVFDETHLGIVEQTGVMTLVHAYHLQGVLLGLLLLAGLFVWHNATSLVPPVAPAAARAMTTVTGQDSASGLVSLLQRYVAAPDVLRLCVEEWHKAMPMAQPGMVAKLAQMRQVVSESAAQPPGAQRLLEGYAALSHIVQTKR